MNLKQGGWTFKLVFFLALIFSTVPVSPQESRADQESKIRKSLEMLGRAMADQDKDTIANQFHIPRLIQEFQRAGLPTPEGQQDKARLLVRIRQMLPAMAAGPAALGLPWEKIRTVGVKVLQGGDEAEALCWVTMGGARSKVRFWLARDGTEWKAFDMEFMEAGVRLSLTAGALAAAIGKDGEANKAVLASFRAIFKAVKQIMSGELEEARESLHAARNDKSPGVITAWIEVLDAQALQALDKHEEALQAADRALERQKGFHLAHSIKAASYVALKEYQKAILAEKEYLRLAGDDPEAWALLGDAYERLKEVDLAIEAYRKGAASDDEDFANRFSAGRLLLARGKAAEAKPLFQAASKNAPPDEDTFEEAADLLAGAGEYASVLEMAEERLRRTPDDATVLIWQGRSLRKLSRFGDAEKVLQHSLDKESKSHGLLEELVFALAQGGKEGEALKYLKGYEVEAPSRARFLRLFIHAAAGRIDKALEELRPILLDDPDELDAIHQESTFDKLRQNEDAKKLMDAARAKREFTRDLGQFLVDKNWEGLVAFTRKRIAVAPEDGEALHFQGIALRRLKRFEEAERVLRQASNKWKKGTESEDELGRTLASLGRVEEALAIAKNPDMVRGLLLQVAIHAIAKNPEAALKALEELLKDDAGWHEWVEDDKDLEELRKLPACQALLKKAREKK